MVEAVYLKGARSGRDDIRIYALADGSRLKVWHGEFPPDSDEANIWLDPQDNVLKRHIGGGIWGDAGIVGAQGPQGPVGPQGPLGPQGPIGETGPAGPQGLQGVQGVQGATGAKGDQGDAGPQGLPGEPGPQGLQGAAGPAGETGPAGENGERILSGDRAPTADDGEEDDYWINLAVNEWYGPKAGSSWGSPTSLVGPPGEPGEPGPQGAQGPQGEAAVAGLIFHGEYDPLVTYESGDFVLYQEQLYVAGGTTTGQQPDLTPAVWMVLNITTIPGPEGPTGPAGPVGPQGDAGPQGVAGADGATGAQGPIGATGPQGAQGPAGPQGVAGPTGATGPQGAQGPQGVQGPQGATGAQGPQGEQGPQGVQGIQGETGPSILNYRGNWDPGETYAVNDWVAFFDVDRSRGFFALVANTNVEPTSDTTTWAVLSVEGPVGAPGPAGPQGIQGPAGPEGPEGPVGATGAQGPAGPEGAIGPEGPEGIQGPAGPAGATGAQGPTGPEGPIGPAGPSGAGALTGRVTATINSSALTVDVSATDEWPLVPNADLTQFYVLIDNELIRVTNSVVLSSGVKRMTIVRAQFGTSASAHNKNAVVALRPYGLRGPAGAQGPAGPQGETGAAGAAGAQGPAGPAGETGAAGAQGPAGPEGPIGPQGPVGETGAQGPAGPAGETGAQGPEGPAGAAGASSPWVKTGAGVLYAAWADGDPIVGDDYHRTNRFVNLTPSNIGSGTQARAVRFRLPVDLEVSSVYIFGVGSTSGVGYTAAIYPVGTGSNKIWDNNGSAFTPTGVGWITMTGGTPFTLLKDTDYWMCISNTGAGAAPGVFTPQTYNNISTYLASGPLANRADSGIPNVKVFTLAGSGVFPATMPAVSAPANITGTVPIFFLEGVGS